MMDKRVETDSQNSSRFYLSQVNLHEAWIVFKEVFYTYGSFIIVLIIFWLVDLFVPPILPEGTSKTISSILSWIWLPILIMAFWADYGGQQVTIPKFSKKHFLLISIAVCGWYLLDYLPRRIQFLVILIVFFVGTNYVALERLGKEKYEKGVEPSDTFNYPI